ncbi:hypothetical protein QJS04_geneDACA012936 [Acorus gramineus]|uniref:Uncharacterized protein n=1 Tax=Acorus gramineus TaxID=55184 RepID=A0AAV9B4R2_ACOGR|nr:hypothetical protein QJS04_geneDACA012936 [Acorus gramineus]
MMSNRHGAANQLPAICPRKSRVSKCVTDTNYNPPNKPKKKKNKSCKVKNALKITT